VEQIDKNIVLIQDRFVFTNLCHFLFDGVTRILHYVENFGVSSDDLFVLGSIPGDYQALICAALSDHIGIPPENLVFPTGAHLLATSRKCFWFSDQMEAHAHPAQMAHPRSLSALAELCARVPAPAGAAKRIYVSRGDAERRRVANEAELVTALESRGFASVQLARLPPGEQIGLFRGAQIVVGPHGMGLTQIIMGGQLGRMIELFHPNAGTDAYAWVARAGGIEYDFVVGAEVPNTATDFTVDVSRVLGLLGPEDAPVRRPAWRKSANLIPGSRTFEGFFPVGASRVEPYAEPMVWGQEARLHRKRGTAAEVGRWPHILITSNRRYTASCWVWIPEDFAGDEVTIRIGDWKDQAPQPADPGKRNTWQRIWSSGVAPVKDRCWVGLHVQGGDASIVSTCWQFESGGVATSYVATG
jgi:hypothetical protein